MHTPCTAESTNHCQSSIILSPLYNSLRCKSHQTTLEVRVGCPPQHHLRVKNPEIDSSQSEFCDELKADNYMYSVPAGWHSQEGVQDQELSLKYPWTQLGCPTPVFHQDDHLPKLELWSGNEKIRDVHGEFQVREINQRSDWTLTESADGILGGSSNNKIGFVYNGRGGIFIIDWFRLCLGFCLCFRFSFCLGFGFGSFFGFCDFLLLQFVNESLLRFG